MTTLILDGNGRQTQLIDDRGDITLFAYDTLDREVTMTFHDGSTRTNVYDEAGDVVTYHRRERQRVPEHVRRPGAEDGRGDYAGRGRASARPRPSRSSTTASRGRPSPRTTASGSANADVTLVYDSLGRVLEDSQAFAGQHPQRDEHGLHVLSGHAIHVPQRPA